MVNSKIIWADQAVINNAESGDVVGYLKWFNVEYNVIKIIKTPPPFSPLNPEVSFWLDKNIMVTEYFKDAAKKPGEWGESLTDFQIYIKIRDSLGILNLTDSIFLGTSLNADSFHNSLMATGLYTFFIHPQCELPTWGDFSIYLGGGNINLITEKAWNKLNLFAKSSESQYGDHWVAPVYVTGSRFFGMELPGTASISIRTVKFLNPFTYKLNYLYKKKFWFFEDGVDYLDYNLNYPSEVNEELEELFKDFVRNELEIEEGSADWDKIFSVGVGIIVAASIIYAVFRMITDDDPHADCWWRRESENVSDSNIGWAVMAIGLGLILFALTKATLVDDIDKWGMLRLKVRDSEVPTKDPKQIKTDPNFFGCGY